MTTFGVDGVVSPALHEGSNQTLTGLSSQLGDKVSLDVCVTLPLEKLIEIFIVVLCVTLLHDDLIDFHEASIGTDSVGTSLKEVDNPIDIASLDFG